MRQLALAFQFLTIMPIKVKGDVSAGDLSRSAVFFPVVGAFQGLATACASALFIVIFPLEIMSGLVILVPMMINGGFHVDGLADTFDALAVKSSGNETADREKRLSVMKDSTIGAIGVVAIAAVMLLKFLFIKNLAVHTPKRMFLSLLFLMPAYSKWAMVPAVCHGTAARQDGLGKIFIDSVGIGTVILSFLLVTLFYFLTISFFHGEFGAQAILLYLSLSILLYLFGFISVRFCKKRFGGLTGDNLGAISEISEILFLMVTSIWLQHFI